MPSIRGCNIQTIHNPARYTVAQIDKAAAVAHLLQRGAFVLTEPPLR